MRRPKLRKKKVKGNEYWYTAAAGSAYFGKVGEVAYEDARRHFADQIKEGQVTIQNEVLTVEKLIDHFLEWIEENRSKATYQTRRRTRPGDESATASGDSGMATVRFLTSPRWK